MIVSLKAKLKACVGKYRTTLARLPRQKEATPCSAATRVKLFFVFVFLCFRKEKSRGG